MKSNNEEIKVFIKLIKFLNSLKVDLNQDYLTFTLFNNECGHISRQGKIVFKWNSLEEFETTILKDFINLIQNKNDERIHVKDDEDFPYSPTGSVFGEPGIKIPK